MGTKEEILLDGQSAQWTII